MYGFFHRYYDYGQFVFDLAYALIPIAIALLRGFRPAARWIGDWKRNHDLRLSAGTTLEVSRHLQRAKRIRTIGFCIGWLAYPGFSIAVHDYRQSKPLLLGWAWLATYLAAAILADALYARAQRPQGAASLEPRAVDDYLPRWVLVVERAAIPLIAMLALAYAALPWREPTGFGPSVAGYVFRASLIVPLVVIAVLLQRNVVRRPQPFVADELRATDDALRANAMHTIASAFLLASGALVAHLGSHLGTRVDVQTVRYAAALSPLVYWAGLVLFIGWASPLHGWFVRNRDYSHPAS